MDGNFENDGRYCQSLALLDPPRTTVRTHLITRIRRQIAQGTYETPDKLDAAIDAMLPALRGA